MIDCLVIGAGPAGLTATLYLRRFYREVMLADAGSPRAALVPESHNYPGFPEGISGKELLTRMRRQLEHYGGEVVRGQVDSLLKRKDGCFEARMAEQCISARKVLLATGGVDLDPDLAGTTELKQRGLLRYCPICDAFEFSQRKVDVIGKDMHGVREVKFLKRYSDDLTFIGLGPHADLDQDLVEQLRQLDAKLLLGDAQSLQVNDGNNLIALTMADGRRHYFDVLYSALGTNVRSSLAMELGAATDEQGCLQVDAHLQTGVPGLYAAGDVVGGLAQLSVAIGHAAIAATAIHNSLDS